MGCRKSCGLLRKKWAAKRKRADLKLAIGRAYGGIEVEDVRAQKVSWTTAII